MFVQTLPYWTSSTGIQRRPDLLEADHARGKPCAGVGVDVATVKSVGVLGSPASIDVLIDLTQRLDAVAFGDQ
jgi:hypothetical protein